MRNRLSILIIICILFTASSCATTGTRTVTSQSRTISYEKPSVGISNAIIFVPKGAYITHINDKKAFTRGTWVRALPDASLWPQHDTPPSVFTARVVAREKDAARLEILAYSDGMRASYDLSASSYEPSHASNATATTSSVLSIPTHAITKRLLFPLHATDTTAVVPQPGLNNIRGNELYAAFDLAADRQRLGTQLRAVMRVTSTNTDEAELTAWRGNVPENSGFVLMDAWTQPGYRVQIYLTKRAENLRSKISQYLQNMPSADHIDLMPGNHDVDPRILGGKQTDTLVLYVDHQPQQDAIDDQMLRIGLNLWSFASLQSDETLTALDAATRALIMTGDHLSAIWLYEKALQDNPGSALIFSAIAPALAAQYHAIERDDWALEIALEARAYLEKAHDVTLKARLHLAIGAIAAEINRVEEFKDTFKALTNNRSIIAAADARRRFYVLSLASMSTPTYLQDAHSAWHHFVEKYKATATDTQMRCFLLYPGEEDACDVASSGAQTPFERLLYQAIPKLRTASADDPDLPQLLSSIDDVGAPFIAQLIWLHLAHQARGAEIAETLRINAAQYAHRSQNHLAEAAIMDEVRRSRAMRSYFPRNNEFESAIKRWQSMDARSHLAAICYDHATQGAHSLEERNTLLMLARELYLSIGDATNAETCARAMK